ncbi:hypothetical protein D477_002461 [Arthrobacter crystallopoietes BAB-32]|uniref:Uncharacterized protein n=1 Tax=Arthrobacter crystallopoietes BAB-32 TaxID=1246476 RepID=N1UZF0_9MICC|nr:hypothetical protein [Arthrobacter crystallopoietes]EMY35766.1 hypothetical protein D477_002461 [Arthrobacter crystallopoietes BAB-32]
MERQTALIVIEGRFLDAAIHRSRKLVDGLVAELPYACQPPGDGLYAVGMAGSLRTKLPLPRDLARAGPYETASGPLHFIWAAGSWFQPETSPPPPIDANGATAWQWLHYNVLHDAEPSAVCLLWEIFPLEAAGAA